MKKKISEKNIRGLVLTLKPNSAQKLLLDKHLNGTRFIYNQYVEEYLKAIKEERMPNYKDYQDLRAEHEFLEGSNAWTLQQVLYRFKQTNKINKTKRSKGQKVGLVNFKCKNIKPEFLNGKIKFGLVKRTKTGEYKISLCIEVNKVYEDREDNKHVGLDFSLRDFFVDSFGAKAPGFSTKRSKMESFQEKIDSLNTTISKMRNKSKKKRKTSVKMYRLAIKRNKLYERVHNVQVDYINKLSRDLCKHNELIVLENLNLKNMAEHTSYKDSKTSSKGGNHGKSIGLLQWSYFLNKLEQNAEKFGNVIVYADKFFPSSQICSKCGEIHLEMKDVTNRTLKCNCGTVADRDYNSAINLLKFGETVVYNKSYQTLGKAFSEYKAFRCLDYRVTRDPQMSELELQLL